MRIAFVSDCWWPRINGVTVSIQTFRDELARRGHQTLVLAPTYPGAPPDPLDPPVKRFRSVNARISKEDRFVGPDAFPAVFQALDQFAPDIVHFNTEFGMFLAGRIWCQIRGKPVFITCHTNWEFYVKHYAPWIPSFITRRIARKYMRRAYLNADYVLIPSPQIGELLNSYGVEGPFHALPTGIAQAAFRSTPEELASYRNGLDERIPTLKGKRVMLFVGRLGDEKNVSFLLPVLQRVVAAVPETALILIGDGPYKRILLDRAAALGLAGHIHTPGYMDRADLRLAYGSADVFVFPSKTETQGLTTIEAMMSGTPVVAIGEMGTRDVMQGDNGGYMVPEDPDLFSAAVVRLLSDPELRAAKSKEAREWASRFSVMSTTDRLEGHYEACLREFTADRRQNQ